MNTESEIWAGLIVCAIGTVVCFGVGYGRAIADFVGAAFMWTAIIVIGALCILVSAVIGVAATLAVRRDRKRDIVIDPRPLERLHAAAALERRFEAIRRERGIDKHGRLLPERRGPHTPAEVIDLNRYAIRRQAL
jgi:hypothetical protein